MAMRYLTILPRLENGKCLIQMINYNEEGYCGIVLCMIYFLAEMQIDIHVF